MKFIYRFLPMSLAILMVLGSWLVSMGQADARTINKVRINWPIIAGAVSYRLEIMKAPDSSLTNRVKAVNRIPVNGYELNTEDMPEAEHYYWRVCPLGYNGNVIGDYTDIKPLKNEELNPSMPRGTTEFNRMAYVPLYPVFSWIPVAGSGGYDVHISREKADSPGQYQVIRSFQTDSNVLYEDGGYTWPGRYMWQVRSVDKNGQPNTEWSEPDYFTVENRVKVAALGDSITHGGGTCNTPPGYVIYSWETYSKVPIKNLGHSGDTVQDMAARFDRDVVCFSPKILVIMGGVNNFRAGDSGWDTIAAMEQILAECQLHDIIPVFATATPINADLMQHVETVEEPVWNWQAEQEILNQWIMNQPYHVDVTTPLKDEYGQLKENFTTDGLHPDHEGKRIIGEIIANYLLTTFPEYDLLNK